MSKGKKKGRKKETYIRNNFALLLMILILRNLIRAIPSPSDDTQRMFALAAEQGHVARDWQLYSIRGATM